MLKETETREWSGWTVNEVNYTKDMEKERLAKKYPGLMTGPHGATLRNNHTWQPSYIITASVARDKLTATTYNTDLKICTVFWTHKTTGLVGLSFDNNHVDPSAKFTSFAVDG